MAFERITQKDWYKILGAKPSDSPAELKRKYQKLALLYHPDKQKADVPAGEVEERVQRFIEIDQAWKILGNEETKKEYDLQQRVLLHSLQLVPWQQNGGEINSSSLNARQAASEVMILDKLVDAAVNTPKNKGIETAAKGNSGGRRHMAS
ncbi:hypothetical protein llap_14798 [Limosa lapponica baueri]|uniref:J domain-containing protein n=1 Tax=Limosa lapponica baueri TaxID=1758121 RepID=A0A2I0TM66_LIMLA|nr:hypothetical protein llap_14798 [Limosa lapponica baueri]